MHCMCVLYAVLGAYSEALLQFKNKRPSEYDVGSINEEDCESHVIGVILAGVCR